VDLNNLQSLIAGQFEALRELAPEERRSLRRELEAQAIAIGSVLKMIDAIDSPGRLQLPKLPPPLTPNPSPNPGRGGLEEIGPEAQPTRRLRNQPAIKQDRRRRTK